MKHSDIYRTIPDEKNFLLSVADTIASKLEQQGVNLPMDACSKAYMDIRVPEIIWSFFGKFRADGDLQEKTAGFAIKLSDYLAGYKDDDPVAVAEEKFLEAAGYKKLKIREISFS